MYVNYTSITVQMLAKTKLELHHYQARNCIRDRRGIVHNDKRVNSPRSQIILNVYAIHQQIFKVTK